MKNAKSLIGALAMATGLAALAQTQPQPPPAAPAPPPANAGNIPGVPAPTRTRPPAGVSTGMGGGMGGGYTTGGYGTVIGPGQPGAAGGGGGGFTQRLQSIIARASGAQESSGPLLIRFTDMEPAAEANLEEDMSVMAHILEKAAGEAGSTPNRAMGVDLAFTPGGESKRDLYVEGYGFVFMLRVGFPLVAPPGKSEETSQETAADSEWERAKRELHGQPNEAVMTGIPSEPYREERVSQLRDALLDALKNANNIRELKADESVTVCVIGSVVGGGPIPRPMAARLPPRPLRPAANGRIEPMSTLPPRTENATMMTIRVTKADIQNAAKDKSALETLRKKAKVLTYASAGN